MWQGCFAGQSGASCEGDGVDKSYAAANSYCADLSWRGYEDWRLPTIDELRSLIRGCAVTAAGGDCDITHECAPNVAGEPCVTPQCTGCSEGGGPSSSGCYIPSELPGASCAASLWSSSQFNESLSYYLWTGAAHLDVANKEYEYKVRCIRD
jgi:hypothetical protein